MTAPPGATTAQPAVPVQEFVQRFSATRLGARLARHLAVHQMERWGFPYGGRAAEAVGVIVGELAANAVTHGRVRGRDFELRLTLGGGTLRIEVGDTRTERRPPGPGEVTAPEPLADSGRGLLLVEALASRWSVQDRAVGKTVRAELDLP